MKICGVVVRVDRQVYMGRFRSLKDATDYEELINQARKNGGIVGVLDVDTSTNINKVVNVPAEDINLVFIEELHC